MRRLWYLLIGSVIFGSLLPGGSPLLRAVALLHLNDKVQHCLSYAVLAWFPVWLDSRSDAVKACITLVGLGIVLEILQLLMPGRSCELLDALADLAGVLTGALAAIVFRGMLQKNLRPSDWTTQRP
jgi:VanZ family protein